MPKKQQALIPLLGAFAVTGFAPFYWYPIPLLALAGLFWRWRVAPPRQAFQDGYLFGLGLYGAGISWIYISLHDYGNMPAPMAATATMALAAFLAVFPALAGYISARFFCNPLWAAPFAWVLSEWLLNWIFTGFPWLTLGNTQIPYGPWASVAPILGVFGVSLCVAFAAALLAAVFDPAQRRTALIVLALLMGTGLAANRIDWVSPIGKPLPVSLLQGNITQDVKWETEEIHHTLETYLALARSAPATLTVLPETALPIPMAHIPEDYRKALSQAGGGEVISGVVEFDQGQMFNSAATLSNGLHSVYRKHHLVPFGEFIPFKSLLGWVYRDWLKMPLADFSRGATAQTPIAIQDQYIAINICYEDVFGEEIIRQLPKATLLLNLSNDAWYGQSLAAVQHMQMSQTRARETGRPVLRATNTGATAIIDPRGEIMATLPQFTAAALRQEVQGYTGTTPYVRWGNWPVISLLFTGLWGLRRRKTLGARP